MGEEQDPHSFSNDELREHAEYCRSLLDRSEYVPGGETSSAATGDGADDDNDGYFAVEQPRPPRSSARRRQPHPPWWFTEHEHVRLQERMREVVLALPATPRARAHADKVAGVHRGPEGGKLGRRAGGYRPRKKGTKGRKEYADGAVPAVLLGRGQPHELISLPAAALESVMTRLHNRGESFEGALVQLRVTKMVRTGEGDAAGWEEREVKQLVTPHRVMRDPFTNAPTHIEFMREEAGDVRGAAHLRNEFGQRYVPV